MNNNYCKSSSYPLINRGYFTGNIYNTDIRVGYYAIGSNTEFVHTSFPSNFSPWYGVLIQFDTFRIQLIIGGSSQGFRRRVGNPPKWDPWKILQ